jgi:hypothetical protein
VTASWPYDHQYSAHDTNSVIYSYSRHYMYLGIMHLMHGFCAEVTILYTIISHLLHTSHATQCFTVSSISLNFSTPGTSIMLYLVPTASTSSIVKVVIEIRPAHAGSNEQGRKCGEKHLWPGLLQRAITITIVSSIDDSEIPIVCYKRR